MIDLLKQISVTRKFAEAEAIFNGIVDRSGLVSVKWSEDDVKQYKIGVLTICSSLQELGLFPSDLETDFTMSISVFGAMMNGAVACLGVCERFNEGLNPLTCVNELRKVDLSPTDNVLVALLHESRHVYQFSKGFVSRNCVPHSRFGSMWMDTMYDTSIIERASRRDPSLFTPQYVSLPWEDDAIRYETFAFNKISKLEFDVDHESFPVVAVDKWECLYYSKNDRPNELIDGLVTKVGINSLNDYTLMRAIVRNVALHNVNTVIPLKLKPTENTHEEVR